MEYESHKSKKIETEMITFRETMLLLKFKRQDFVQISFFKWKTVSKKNMVWNPVLDLDSILDKDPDPEPESEPKLFVAF